MSTHYKTKRTSSKWPCRKDKNKFRFIEMCFSLSTKQSKMRDIRLQSNSQKGKIKSKTWRLSMSPLFKKHVIICLISDGSDTG